MMAAGQHRRGERRHIIIPYPPHAPPHPAAMTAGHPRCTPGHRRAGQHGEPRRGVPAALPPHSVPSAPVPVPAAATAPLRASLLQLGRVRFAHGVSTEPLALPLAPRSDVTTSPACYPPPTNENRTPFPLPPRFLPFPTPPTPPRQPISARIGLLPHSPERRRGTRRG